MSWSKNKKLDKSYGNRASADNTLVEESEDRGITHSLVILGL